MYICSLDAEGMFDAILHPVLFAKTLNVISNMSWRLLYCLYTDMTINIKWKYLSRDIPICKGTKHGGLCSPFLIDHLNSQNGKVTIGKYKYNAFCYADDVLLTSTTVSGLQNLMDTANEFITQHGLRFSPLKTNCLIQGKNPFDKIPSWFLKNTVLVSQKIVKYLLKAMLTIWVFLRVNVIIIITMIMYKPVSVYVEKSFILYKVQKCHDLSIDTSIYIWLTVCQSVLSYGCEYLFNRKKYDGFR